MGRRVKSTLSRHRKTKTFKIRGEDENVYKVVSNTFLAIFCTIFINKIYIRHRIWQNTDLSFALMTPRWMVVLGLQKLFRQDHLLISRCACWHLLRSRRSQSTNSKRSRWICSEEGIFYSSYDGYHPFWLGKNLILLFQTNAEEKVIPESGGHQNLTRKQQVGEVLRIFVSICDYFIDTTVSPHCTNMWVA